MASTPERSATRYMYGTLPGATGETSSWPSTYLFTPTVAANTTDATVNGAIIYIGSSGVYTVTALVGVGMETTDAMRGAGVGIEIYSSHVDGWATFEGGASDYGSADYLYVPVAWAGYLDAGDSFRFRAGVVLDAGTFEVFDGWYSIVQHA